MKIILIIMFAFSALAEAQEGDIFRSLRNAYEWRENNCPAAGYSVTIKFDKRTKVLSSSLECYGSRGLDEPLNMPTTINCPFCQPTDDSEMVSTDLIQLRRSLRRRMLLTPAKHIPHWFDAPDDQLKLDLLQMAVEVSDYVESVYPGKLTTDYHYVFRFHVGTAAGQTVPHLHLRFEGGKTAGILSEEEWKTLFSTAFSQGGG